MTEQTAWSDDFIRKQIPRFKWFSHVDFGNNIIARSTSWPEAPMDSRHMGISKFEFIVRRNLPDLRGKRILELGCNCGIIAIEMIKLGAAEVTGVDCERTWPKWREQAEFVKGALEWRHQREYNVKFVESDLKDFPQLGLPCLFDGVVALNCLYYLEEKDIERVMVFASEFSDFFLIQCNTKDQKHLGDRPTPRYMKRALERNGFPVVTVDWPWDLPRKRVVPQRYCRPVVVGRKRAKTA